jgi:hypothetical protein
MQTPGGRRMSIDSQQSAATTGDATSSEDELDHQNNHSSTNNTLHPNSQRLQVHFTKQKLNYSETQSLKCNLLL